MEGDHPSPRPRKVLGASRSNIPRMISVPKVSNTVQAARNLKRRSIDTLNNQPRGAPPPKRTASSAASARTYSVTAPLPDHMRTGRATMASTSSLQRSTATTPGNAPRCLHPTSSVARRNNVSLPAPRTQDARPPIGTARRSTSTPRENAIIAELQAKLQNSEAEKNKLSVEVNNLSAETDLMKSQITLKEQSITTLQSSVECIREALELKDTQIGTMQVNLDAEKSKSSLLQMKNEQLENELRESRAEIEQLKRQLSSNRGELLEKDETIRNLNNEVVDLRGQIRIVVRVRPPLGKERDVPTTHISYPAMSSIKLDQGKSSQTYDFQSVFAPNMTQARLFADVEELILSCLHGYNVSIIAYGQTGSGKTFTMRGGDGDSAGIIPRAVRFLFQSRDKLADLDWAFQFEASYLEVYNEEVYDLLANRNRLELKIGSGITIVPGLKQQRIVDEEDIENILAVADRTRSTASTKCNEQSSRSHAVFALAIQGSNRTTGVNRFATLYLVDLAGSERVKESGAEGERFKETTYINSALSNLQNCIRSQLNKSTHIPYRNSKLTMLLRDSLGAGNSKTLVIVTLNPALTQAAETKRSLDFAQQMSITKIGCARKQEQ